MSVIETKAPVAVESYEIFPGNFDCRIYGGTYEQLAELFDYELTLSEPKNFRDSANVGKRIYSGLEFLKKITTHDKRPDKDGPAFHQGELTDDATARTKTSMKKNCLLALDSDTGEEETYLRSCLLEAGLCGIIASSHSHLKTETSIAVSGVAP